MTARRRVLLAMSGAWIGSCVRNRSAPAVDAVVGDASTVAGRRFESIAAALGAAPRGDSPYRIHLGTGLHHERLTIRRSNVSLVGEGAERSVLSHDRAAGMPGEDGRPLGTWGCATLTIAAPGFRASDLTIENAFDYLGHLREPHFEAIGPNGAQAVALMLAAGADRSVIERVALHGHQDTLFVDAGVSQFRDCRVRGSVDFVFGAGEAHFDHCELQSRFRPDKPRQGYVAVPSTARGQELGLVFRECRLTREPEVPDASVALGRPWRPTRAFPDGHYGDPDAVGMAAFIDCWMDAHIDPVPWDAMSYTARDGTRVAFTPDEARFSERGSHGPGARRT